MAPYSPKIIALPEYCSLTHADLPPSILQILCWLLSGLICFLMDNDGQFHVYISSCLRAASIKCASMWGLIKSCISKECTSRCYGIRESRSCVFFSDVNWICLFFIKVWKMDASHLIYLRCWSPFYNSRCTPFGRYRVLFFLKKIIYQLEGKRDERQEIPFAFRASKWIFTTELLCFFFPSKMLLQCHNNSARWGSSSSHKPSNFA